MSQGYHAAAMDEIAERAGVSKPVLYQHFPGKLELYLALLDESVGALVDTVRDALGSNADPKQRVAATFGAYFEYVGGKGQAYRLVFESDLSNEPAVRDRLDAGPAPVRRDGQPGHQGRRRALRRRGAPARAWAWSAWPRSPRGTGSAPRDHIPREAAEQLVARLAWRGISGWPRSEH